MATVGPTNVPAFFNTDADFRTWGSTISAALATLGLVQTADTGQINWTTVSKPAGTSASQGYEIWKFNDALQAGTPIFLKLEYGSGAGAADRPAFWITVGSGSNGSGTLTGQLSTRQAVGPQSSKTAGVSLPFYISGNAGELLIAANIDTANNNFGLLVAVERPKDNADNPTSEGCLVSTCGFSSGSSQYVPATGAVPALNTSTWCTLHPGFWARSAAGASADATPVFIPIAGVWRFSHLLITSPGDFAAGGTLTATIFGATHTYMAFDKTFIGGASMANSLIPGCAFKWE